MSSYIYARASPTRLTAQPKIFDVTYSFDVYVLLEYPVYFDSEKVTRIATENALKT